LPHHAAAPDDAQRRAIEQRNTNLVALAVLILVALPPLYALMGTPPGAFYLGFQFATDDHMVYSAWMRQAMDGRLLMDNRFAVDPQPGLTVHLYFFLVGQLARLTGIALAAHLARILFSVLFVYLAANLIRRVTPNVFTSTLALIATVLGGGIGFLVWHNFGRELVRPSSELLSRPLLGRQPVDVWQPEAFVFPSMLTNGLFMVSLCLILVVLLSVLDARKSWRPVLPGAAAMLVLMNIHSYDVLLIALVLVAFLVAAVVRRQAEPAWILRAVAIGAGAIPSALWFLHVLRNDPVFQARAATPTFSPNFRQVFAGYLIMILLALVALYRPWNGEQPKRATLIGLAGFALLLGGLNVAASAHVDARFWMDWGPWIGVFVAAIAITALLSREEPAWNLLVAWGVVGLVAPYLPALFQRKLAMGLAVPWAILGAIGLAILVSRHEKGARNLATALGIIVLAATSMRWHFREWRVFAANDVSNTVVHPVYVGPDTQRILQYLNDRPKGTRTVVVAMPGIMNPVTDGRGQPVPDSFASPYLPDLNPILTGFAGVYTYAGHWSETPRYDERRAESTTLFLTRTTPGQRAELLERMGAHYLVAPVPEAFNTGAIADLRGLGQVVVDGDQFALVRLR
jgi:hypothetical protein